MGWFTLPGALDPLRWMVILLGGGLLHFVLCCRLLDQKWQAGKKEVLLILVFALVFRVTLLSVEPTLSDDVYRNIWDGRVQTAGIDPYRYEPTHPALQDLRDPQIWPKINHSDYKTIYPPLTQYLAWGAAVMAESFWDLHPILSWKLTLLSIETLGLFLFGLALQKTTTTSLLLIYAWSPLAVVEFYGSGHVDAAGVGLLAGSIGLCLLGPKVMAGAFLGGAILVKWILLPVSVGLLRIRNRRRAMTALALTAAGLCLPYLSSGGNFLESLGVYVGNWEFNGVLHRLFQVDAWAAWPRRIIQENSESLWAPGHPFEKMIGRVTVGILVVGGGIIASLKNFPPSACALGTLGAFLMLQPTIYPWYLTNLLPLLVLRPYKPFMLWLTLSPLTYEAVLTESLTGRWGENFWIQVVAIVPVLVWMLVDLGKYFIMRTQASG